MMDSKEGQPKSLSPGDWWSLGVNPLMGKEWFMHWNNVYTNAFHCAVMFAFVSRVFIDYDNAQQSYIFAKGSFTFFRGIFIYRAFEHAYQGNV